MKLSLRFSIVSLFVLLLSVGAFAAANDYKGSLSIGGPVRLAGKELPAGEYTIQWDGTGPVTQMKVLQNGKLWANVPARVVKLDQKASTDAAETRSANDGVKTLTAVSFEGKNYRLEIAGQPGGDIASTSGLK